MALATANKNTANDRIDMSMTIPIEGVIYFIGGGMLVFLIVTIFLRKFNK